MSSDWAMKFSSAKLYHKPTSASNHNSILLQLSVTKKKKIAKRIFRFESMWLQDQRCERVVVDAWQDRLMGGSAFLILSCLELYRHMLKEWNVLEFRHVGREISQLQKKLEELEMQAASPCTIKALKETRVELNYWLKKEDSLWRQRSRLNWFKDGDRNTRFFHAKASSHF